MPLRWLLVGAVALLLFVGAGRGSGSDQTLCPTIEDLSAQPGWPAGATATALDNAGEIVGYAPGGAAAYAFVWRQGHLTRLGTLGGPSASPAAINGRGEIVGSSDTVKGESHAFVWRDGKMTDLGTLGGPSSAARAIDDDGRIFGFSTKRGATHAFLWQRGKMIDLGAFRDGAQPRAINAAGQVVGTATSPKGESLAILWRHGRVAELGSLGGGSSNPAAISDRGQIVGLSVTGRRATHAALWRGTRIVDLGVLPGGDSSGASAINDEGQVVGWSYLPDNVQRAFLWQSGQLIDLGARRQDLYSGATAINDRGEVLGWSGGSSLGAQHAVLWRPRPTAGSRCPVFKPVPSGDSVVVKARSITVGGPIEELKADARRAMVRVRYAGPDSSLGDCVDNFVWDRVRRKIVTVFDHRMCNGAVALQSFGGIALAGDHAAWVELGGGNILESSLLVTSLASGRTSRVAAEAAGGQGAYGRIVADPAGDDGLLVYRDYTRCAPGPDVSSADIPCPPGVEDYATVADEIRVALPTRRTIARADRELKVLAVGGGRVVAQRFDGTVIVLSPKSGLIARYDYKPGEVQGAASDGRTLALLRNGTLDVVSLPGGHGPSGTRSLPLAAARLADVDGRDAVYIRGNAVYVLDLETGRSTPVAREQAGPVNAQLEPDGLYVSAGRTLTFTPR